MSSPPPFDGLLFSGYSLAFLTAAFVILVDCNNELRKGLGRVPVNVLRSTSVWTVATVCGVVSAACLHFSYAKWFTDGIVDFKWQNPAVRGVLVGLAVLTIVRSKLFNFKENEVGGEFVYSLGRRWALKRLWNQWNTTKDRFSNDARITAAMNRPAFEAELDAQISQALRLDTDEEKKWVKTQFDNLRQTRPAGQPDPQDPTWRLYYKSLIKLALDCGGAHIFDGIDGLR